ncbi:MAG: UXX-star (seleno)protein family 2 [Chloroflexota bacterium]|mgnify:CR=1 FL=1|nr:UXX-star (seleno)protein family 2 [Chloroflexota bacterium]|tara:strand:- start:678 stop:887 length:210 start_codon:yes stop_codon:yes gene_type:complete
MITLYTHPDCNYSDALKDELDNKGETYKEINLALNPEEWDSLIKLTSGERITPVLVNGDTVEIGFHGIG